MVVIQIIGIILNFLLASFAFITLKQTAKINKKNQFYQIYSEVLNDKTFRKISIEIEDDYNLNDESSEFDYFLKTLQNLLDINEKLAFRNFKREFFMIIFVNEYFEYVENLANKGCDDIYSTLFKELEKIKIKFFKENFKINPNININKNYDKALLEYQKQSKEWL